jgi:hypothetical protein
MHTSDFSPWSAYLREHCNDPSLIFDAEGALSLLVDRHKVDCRIVADSMILSARICAIPVGAVERRAHLCRVLTLSNRHARNRREFPVLSGTRTLQLYAWINASIDYEAFSMHFNRFMEALDAWREAVLPAGGIATRTAAQIGDKPFRRPPHTPSTGFL